MGFEPLICNEVVTSLPIVNANSSKYNVALETLYL